MPEKRTVARVLIAKPGLDGHDRGAKIVAKALANAGLEVIYTGLRQSVDQIVGAAVQEGVEVIGLSILSGTHVPLCRKLMKRIGEKGLLDQVSVIVGGNIPKRDAPVLTQLGVSRVFPTGSRLSEIVDFVQAKTGGSAPA